MSGAIDYLLRVVIPNIKAYDPFYKKLYAESTFTQYGNRSKY